MVKDLVRIGIPQALAYHDYGELWSSFFVDLGVEVVLSPATNKSIVDAGVKLAADGTCLPVKTFYGHAAYLAEIPDLDYIFVPRIIGVRPKEFICPKFMGLPDLIENGLKRASPRVLAPEIDLRSNWWKSYAVIARMAMTIGVNPWQAVHRYHQALISYGNEQAEDLTAPSFVGPGELTIGVIGHRYLVQDKHLSMDLLGKLKALGVNVVPGYDLPRELVHTKARNWPKQMFWRSGRIAFGVARSFLEHQPCVVDGAIYVAAFSCGTDSMVGDLVEREFRRQGMPILTVNLDEHTGEAGLLTRLEAFVDLIRWRTDASEMHVSTHG